MTYRMGMTEAFNAMGVTTVDGNELEATVGRWHGYTNDRQLVCTVWTHNIDRANGLQEAHIKNEEDWNAVKLGDVVKVIRVTGDPNKARTRMNFRHADPDRTGEYEVINKYLGKRFDGTTLHCLRLRRI